MNILHVIPGDLWAGAEAQVYYMVKEINTLNQHKISVILFNKGELYRKLLALDIDVIFLDEGTFSNVALCNGIKRILTYCDVHIVHVHEYKSHILTALAKLMARKNRIVLFRTQHGQTVPSRFKSHLVLGCEKIFLKYQTDHLIAVSEELKNLLLKKTIKAKIHLLQNAVDLSVLSSSRDVLKIRGLFGLTKNQLWIGAVARLENVKNLQMLIEAANILKNEHPEFKFRVSIFGEGSLRDILREKISQLNLEKQVFLEGHENNIMPVLQSLDIFTLVSTHEGLPMSLLEAMSVGTIPVCTAVGGMKEVISHGEDGFLISSGDARELAETLFGIFMERTDLDRVRARARKKIRTNFSISQNCKELLSLYEQSQKIR